LYLFARLSAASVVLLAGCAAAGPDRAPVSRRSEPYQGNSPRNDASDPSEAQRLRRVTARLVAAMDRPCATSELRLVILRQTEINAATAGRCQFYVTTALLERASDDRLRGVMAHEIAHQDLGHVAKAQALGVGLNAGVALLEQWIPGSGAVSQLAGTLIARSYGRSEEYAADRHAIQILSRAGYTKAIMLDTLSWIRGASGERGGGFLSTHPALDDRIAALRGFS
jgi:predicted Zn-dependent protease